MEVFGFYREAVIDLSPGFQPWVSRTKRYALKALPTPRGGVQFPIGAVLQLAIREPLSHTVPPPALLLSRLLPRDFGEVHSSPANATSDGLLQPQRQPQPRMQPHWLLTASRIR